MPALPALRVDKNANHSPHVVGLRPLFEELGLTRRAA